MNYITPKEAAYKWGISLRTVQTYCSSNKIPGVVRVGHQWMIPIDSEQPADRRYLEARQLSEVETYHFPGLVYSEYFVSRSCLSEDELSLLEAQLMSLRGELPESIALSRSLTASDKCTSVRFGAWATILISSVSLGLYTEIKNCFEHMEILCRSDPAHEADYRFIMAVSRYMCTFDYDDILAVDMEKLSSDAMTAYICANIIIILMNKHSESPSATRLVSALCRHLELSGSIPCLIVGCSAVAFMSSMEGNNDNSRHYIEKVCSLCYEHSYLRLLCKLSSLSYQEYKKYLDRYGAAFTNRLDKLRQTNVLGFQQVCRGFRNQLVIADLSPEECELLFLLSLDVKVRTLASMKGVPVSHINSIIKAMCDRCGCSSKEELVKYAKEIYYN